MLVIIIFGPPSHEEEVKDEIEGSQVEEEERDREVGMGTGRFRGDRFWLDPEGNMVLGAEEEDVLDAAILSVRVEVDIWGMARSGMEEVDVDGVLRWSEAD